MRNMLGAFPTETLILHKNDGTVAEVTALVDESKIFSDNIHLNIEESDIYERTLPSGGKEYYRIIDRGFYKGDHGIPDNYQSKVEKITEKEAGRELSRSAPEGKPHKLFISHSSKDKEYMITLTELLEDIGMPDGSIVCTSVPGHGIPGGAKIFDWLREQFLTCDLRVLFALSHNYYESALGISFGRDEEELKHRLNEFKDTLIQEHQLPTITQARWERHRDKFIRTVREIAEKHTGEEDAGELEDHIPVIGQDDVGRIPVEPAFLLVYAAEGNGQIIRVQSLGVPTQISVDGRQFMADMSQRESARWQEALDMLISWCWVKSAGRKGQVYELTGTGYKKADWLKDGMQINIKNEPLEELKHFD